MDVYFRTTKLAVGYKNIHVVRDIDVSVPVGKILTIIGPNGCGKSTILKSITKQLQVLAGTVFIADNALNRLSQRELARTTSLVLTERPQAELMTSGDVVAVGRYPFTGTLGILGEQDHHAIDVALHTVGAYELKDKRFDQLSDGQRQRILLARALCQEPRIIVLDEPTSHLDIRFAVEITDILRRMADEKQVTVIMSLHELNYAKRVSDLVMCVKNGHVRYLNTPEAIFTKSVISDLFDLPDHIYDDLFGAL